MRNTIKTLAASAVIFGAASLAHAADAIDEVPIAPEAQEVITTPGGWEGAYVGGKMTYDRGTMKDGKHYNANGLGAGLYTGYNLQNDKIVYGAEADINYSGIDSTNKNIDTKQGLNGSVRARLGYDLDPVLVYGTAGVAATDLKAEDKRSSDDKTLFGLTVGAGVETKITDTITARTEYRFNNYQTQTFDLKSGATDRGLKDHQLSLGLGVRF